MRKRKRCPKCNKEIIREPRQTVRGALIHHLWGAHNLSAPEAHRLADETLEPKAKAVREVRP